MSGHVSDLIAAGTGFMREVNTTAVLRRLRQETMTSVSSLADAVGLSRQAVTRTLNALAEEGLVEFGAPERPTRAGRPAQTVRFRAEAGHVLGIAVGPHDLRIELADLAGRVEAAETVRLDAGPAGSDAPDLLGILVTGVRRVLADGGVEAPDVWLTTVGAPGIVDPEAGVIKLVPSMPELTGDVLLRRLADLLDCPIRLDNDVKLATRAERWRDDDRVEDSLVMVHWGERVGAGILLAGELYRGASNDAGDLGFLDLLVDPAGADRVPGAHDEPHGLGAFESWVGGAEVARLAAEAADRRADRELADRLRAAGDDAFDGFLAAAESARPAALEAIDVVAARFARGVAAIRALLDPRLVVVGGPMTRCGDALLEAVRRHLARQPLNQPDLELSTLRDDAVVRGALHHCLAEIERTRFDRLGSGRSRARG